MPNYPDSFKIEVVERNSIEDVVSEYVTLSKRSGSNRFGLCPFHNERTPSFAVTPSKQIFHCFGCGKGGDVITFIMEIEGMTYPEALEFLARRAGVPIPEGAADKEAKLKARLYALNKDAALFFHNELKGPNGGPGREYLAKRQISGTFAKNFGLGYASHDSYSLHKAMLEKGYTDYEMEAADLIRKGDYGYYDTFRDRLVFPVIDTSGRVIGFSGRALGESHAKYLNSKDTPVFTKGRNLFGLNLAKKSKAGYIMLVEGNIDVVTLHQAGFDSTVASLGTSLTDEQARLISRYTKEVILAYDSDGAGLKAAQRGIGILEKLDVKVRVLRWEGAKDPDDYIKLRGSGAFRTLIEKSESQTEYRLINIAGKYDLTQADQKVEYLKEATKLIAGFSGQMEREIYAAKLAESVGIGVDAVKLEINRRRKQLLGAARNTEFRDTQPERMIQPSDRSVKYTNPRSAVAEEGVIRIIYIEPALAPTAETQLKPEEFSSEALGHIYSVMLERLKSGRDVSVTLLGDELTAAETGILTSVTEKPENPAVAGATLGEYIKTIKESGQKPSEELDLNSLAEKKKNNGKGYK